MAKIILWQLAILTYALFLLAVPAHAADTEEWPTTWFEIFRIAPGRHEAFIRSVARADEVAKAGDQPHIQLFIHQNGADWDVLMFKPVTDNKPTIAQQAAMDAKSKELNMPSGFAYFIDFRKNVLSHTDTKTVGPVAAADWLAKLDQWRAEHADATQDYRLPHLFTS